MRAHTHTYTHIYIYIYMYIYIYIYRSIIKKNSWVFSYRHFYWEYKHKTLVPFEEISSGCNAPLVPLQQLLEGPSKVLLCERVNDLRHSPFHLNCLITTTSGLVYCPGGNAADPIWRLLTSSDGISSWTPLNLNIVTLTGNLWPINPPISLIISYRLPALLESLMPLKNW